MTKPDCTFTITVSPVYRVHSCAEKLAQESRGTFGCHLFKTCPDCKVIAEGYEFWGNNGHRQGGSPFDRVELAYRLRHLAMKQWRMKDGRLMGYHFELGSALYYRGN